MAATNVQSGDVSPNFQPAVTSVTSPWSQVVRGGAGESESVSPVTVTSPVRERGGGDGCADWSPSKVVVEVSSGEDLGIDGQVDGFKKPVWNNRFSNGVVEVVSPVMGAAWPALGESTKPTLKSSSSESLKALSDGSLPPALQVTGSSSPSHKQANANSLNPTSTPNHVAPSRQRSVKRGGGNSSANVSANGVVDQPVPPTSQDSVVEPPINTSGKPGNAGEQPSPRDHAHKESQKGGFGSQSHSGDDHHRPRGSYRRGNGGSYHHNYGGKRDHDRGNSEWNQHSRSFNNRDAHLQPQRGFSRGYIRPSVHTSAPFIPPPMHVPVPPFGNNMMYPDVASSLMYVPPQAMPFGAPIQPQVYYAGHDPLLYANIVNQIDFYFSNENLVRDTYLRRNMDEQGWVSVGLIAGFKKVSYLTDNVQLILDAMRTSTVVEVQGDKIRRRNDWMKWIMPAPGQYSIPSSPQTNHEALVSQVQGLALHSPTSTNQAHTVDTYLSRSSSEDFTGGENASQQARFDNATAA
ncbi:putative la-type HTH domain, winged helix-like DNA-binding domain superfamily [Helianthus annuus]|nr:putative la-type HTH domain, winged helix-like DNA-binding domain superfamily [Helianthus annuus]